MQGNLEKHLLEGIKTGLLTIDSFIPLQVSKLITKELERKGTEILLLKENLGDNFSFFQIKAVVEQYKFDRARKEDET